MALILAVVLAGLVGTTALVFDLGRAWNLGTELQTAVDAAALAGATQLDGKPGARVRAVQAATGDLARNGQIFANASGPGPVTYSAAFACAGDGCAMTNENFRFFAGLDPRSDALSDAEARFIEVSASRTVRFAFAGLLGAATSAAPGARAVAGWERFACGYAALLMCNPDEPAGNRDLRRDFALARHVGKGITLKHGSGGRPAPGEFIWLAAVTCDPASDTCAAAKGAEAVRDAPGRVVPPQACLGGAVAAQPAAIAAVAEFLNMRMDIYPKGGARDFADDPDYQPSPNFLTGLVPDPAAVLSVPASGLGTGPAEVVETLAACDFDAAAGGRNGALRVPDHPFLGPGRHAPNGAEPLDHMGYPRDNCAYPEASGTAPPDNCILAPPADAGLAGGSPLGTGLWDLEAYMAHHHPAVSFTTSRFNVCPAAGCRIGADGTVDLDGDGRLSRWEVYSWEKRGHPPKFGRPQCFGGGQAPLPQPPAGAPGVPDRRLLGALVANCRALAAAFGGVGKSGGEPLPLAGTDPAVNLFLTEAVGELAADAFYAEIVAPAALDEAGALGVRDRIVLYE
ncbi:MAG: pilus assembly protein TadG-related protein [Kiloniellaceae bacterium]